ncbi:hypothetical protein OG792_27540 [Micromonospora sp. NBC_01699]|uniref:hypothetical protein n=1 Tax=Micromonospora sp. NBC_01699 TaxID=2975984 RepID=UPI002E2CA276|nr:hypothetical protein [Micromonospora sp. NBC_01699]
MTEVPAVHVPARPDWSCRACGQEWPCIVRKHQLKYLYQGNPAGLGRQLRLLLRQAREDLPALTDEQLAERFVYWSERPLRAGRTWS